MLSSPSLYKSYSTKHPRVTNQTVLAVITLIGCVIAGVFAKRGQDLFETISVGTGYVGLLLIVATLVIGPINMLRARKNPVNINLRRDVGIWAGITSLAHVLFAALLQLSWGDTLLGFFLNANGSPKLDLFGISDYFGLIGALVIIFLLVISNNYYLKKLKGKSWKNLQRFNYLLFVVVVAHTFTQQVNNERGMLLIVGALALTLSVVVAQAIGFVVYRKRSQVRKTVPNTATVSNRAGANPYKAGANQNRAYSNQAVSRQRYNAAPVEEGTPWLKIGLISAAGCIAIFFGFEIGHLGAQLTNQVGSSSSSSFPSRNVSNSSSSGNTQVNPPSFSQPPVRSRHS